MTFPSTHDQADMEHESIESFQLHQKILRELISGVASQVDQRFGQVEELLRAQPEIFQGPQTPPVVPYYEALLRHMRRSPSQDPNEGSESPPTSHAASTAIRVTRNLSLCTHGCPCACHKQTGSFKPALLDWVMGHIILENSVGLPTYRPKCNTPTCAKGQYPYSYVREESWFSFGYIWSRIFHLALPIY